MSFLTAEWRKLVFVNYEIDPQLLEPYTPFGTELDSFDGRYYISLIGFMFMNTAIKGIKVPFHVNFEEVNLRFYVKRKSGDSYKRGVVFVKEIVSKPAIAWVANTLYGEKYATAHMSYLWDINDKEIKVEYKWGKNPTHSMQVSSLPISEPIETDSLEEFITEHYWGYAHVSPYKTIEYEVTHPRWEIYPVDEYSVNCNFEKNYGPSFAILDQLKPSNVLFAEGSAITIESKNIIK